MRSLFIINLPKIMKSPKVLILVKKGHEYTNQMPNGTMKAGLLNSANFIKEAPGFVVS